MRVRARTSYKNLKSGRQTNRGNKYYSTTFISVKKTYIWNLKFCSIGMFFPPKMQGNTEFFFLDLLMHFYTINTLRKKILIMFYFSL